jgi:hypothetical protein
MPAAAVPDRLFVMTSTGLQLTNFVAVAVGAGLLMVVAGTKKKLLRWKPAERRCPTCGRSDRRNCPCRR